MTVLDSITARTEDIRDLLRKLTLDQGELTYTDLNEPSLRLVLQVQVSRHEDNLKVKEVSHATS